MPTTPTEVWLALRSDGALGAGRIDNPYDASSPSLFSYLMNSIIGEKTVVHLGPGIFQTYGFVPNGTNTWQPKSGQRIIGAGMYATTLKVVGATNQDFLTLAVGNDVLSNFLDGFEASDFSIDCNMAAHAGNGVSIGAIWAQGRHIRLCRLRAINFGTEGPARNVECFVVGAGGAHPYIPEVSDSVVSDCVIEKPWRNNIYTTSSIILFGGESDPSQGWMAFHRNCVVRNCLINAEYSDTPVAISSIKFYGTDTGTVVTKTPHNRSKGQWIVISSALVGSVPSNQINGSLNITQVDSDVQFKISTAPNLQSSDPTGDMYLGKYSSHFVGIQSLSLDSISLVASLTTEKPHNRVIGDNVVLNNVLVGGEPSPDFNKPFQITAIQSPTVLQFAMTTNPGTPDVTSAFIGVYFNGISADAGSGAIVENNRISNVSIGYYHDTWSTKDVVIRENHFSAISTGIYQAMGQVSGGDNSHDPTRISDGSPTHSGTLATLKTVLAHKLSAGQAVVVAGAPAFPSPLYNYNGTFLIQSVPDPKSFTYQMPNDPGSGDPGALKWGALWQVGRMIAERNTVDLVLNLLQSYYGPPLGFDILGFARIAPYVFGQIILRGNLIRNVDDAVDITQNSYGIRLDSCENAVVEANIINLNNGRPIMQQNTCGLVKYFSNQTPAGKLAQGYLNHVTPELRHYVNELPIDADMAVLLET